VIELAQCNSHLPGKIDQRYREGNERDHEQDGHPALMLNREKALANATITKSGTAMLLITAQKIARFSIAARRMRRGRSVLRRFLAVSSSEMAFKMIVLSMTLFRREISTAMKAANAPSRNAGAAACEMTWDS
jgi:hypothetical protein